MHITVARMEKEQTGRDFFFQHTNRDRSPGGAEPVALGQSKRDTATAAPRQALETNALVYTWATTVVKLSFRKKNSFILLTCDKIDMKSQNIDICSGFQTLFKKHVIFHRRLHLCNQSIKQQNVSKILKRYTTRVSEEILHAYL